MCRSHGLPTTLTDVAWTSDGAAPPRYPNAVTLVPDAVLAQLDVIDALGERLGLGEWGVKDSFRALSLGGRGFRALFDATWIHRRPAPGSGPPVTPGRLRASVIASEDDLGRWERAWRGAPLSAGAPAAPRLFPPALLDEADVAFVAVVEGRNIAAGLVANRAAGATGVSNWFANGPDGRRLRRRCFEEAAALWPGQPLVGYAAAPEVDELLGQGFDEVGELRVWLRGEGGEPAGGFGGSRPPGSAPSRSRGG